LYRVIDENHPTLLIDEADSFAVPRGAGPTPRSEELRGIINSGHKRRLAFALRAVGDEHEPRRFSTFAPMVIALIGKLHGTTEDRAISIALKRRRPGEKIARLRPKDEGAIRDIARRIQRWADDCGAEIAARDPDMPPQLNDRAADNWRLLCAIADQAGGEWGERARAAAVELEAAAEGDQETGVQLLGDIRTIFRKRATDRLPSGVLVADLVELEGRPWAEWGRAEKPLTKNGLAALLRKFRIEPKVIRLDDGRTPRGYTLAAFKDAFARYLGDDREAATDTDDPA
jgi:putative DNA primase/helicase